VEPIGAGGSFLAGHQSGDRAQDRVEVLASAEVASRARRLLRWLMLCSTRIRSVEEVVQLAPRTAMFWMRGSRAASSEPSFCPESLA
jgi:hypothetical protein